MILDPCGFCGVAHSDAVPCLASTIALNLKTIWDARPTTREQMCARPGVRTFDTGAIRSDDTLRDDPEGYWSPLAIDAYNAYMTKHRVQPDGSVRASDNWQLGFPLASCFKGLWRHFLHAWTRFRGYAVRDPKAAENLKEDLCAIIFNAQVALHQIVKEELSAPPAKED